MRRRKKRAGKSAGPLSKAWRTYCQKPSSCHETHCEEPRRTYLRQSGLDDFPRGAEFPDFVENARQLSQRFEENGHETRSLGAAGCSDCEAEAFFGFACGGEDACFQREEVEGLGEVCAGAGEEGGDFGESVGELFRADQEVDFQEGDLLGEFRVGCGLEGEEVGEVMVGGGEVVAGETYVLVFVALVNERWKEGRGHTF